MTATRVFVRRDVWSLPAHDPVLTWYAKAIEVMRTRPDDDPTSWTFQAAIHGTEVHPRNPAFNQCKHGSWFFLAWHRSFLYYFERIVRAAVVASGGPAHWALPYWNYAGGGHSNRLPRAFREPATAANSLYVSHRRASYNAGLGLSPAFTDASVALASPVFTSGPTRPAFGGGRASPLQQFETETGLLEQTPHNDIHVRIGGRNGWMAFPDRAAEDPIFWLHHANIDRLWTQWIAMGHGRADPSAGAWLNRRFAFYDETGRQVHQRPSEVLDTVVQLGYRYDQVPPAPVPTKAAATTIAAGDAAPPPDLVGASAQPTTLHGDAAFVTVDVDGAAREAAAARAAAGGGTRQVILSLDDVRAERTPGTVYGVYVNLPAGALPDEMYRAGNASFFGIERSSAARGGHGFRLRYDITDLAARLAAEGKWDEDHVHVSFHPIEEDAAEVGVAAEPGEHEPVTIGRVSIFHG